MSVALKAAPWALLSMIAAGVACGGSSPAPTETASNPVPSAAPADTTPPTPVAPPAASTPPAPADTAPPPPPAPSTTASAAPSAPPPAAPIEEVNEKSFGAAAHHKLTIADGRPKGLKEGAFESYWVWRDPGSNHWHLRTTTHGVQHRFQGFVVSEDGSLAGVHAVRLEHKDRFTASANRVAFDFSTKGHEDGLEFDAPPDRCLRFALVIDGKGHPDRVVIGKGDSHPSHYHFKICEK